MDALYQRLNSREATMVRDTIHELEAIEKDQPVATMAIATIRFLLMKEVEIYEETHRLYQQGEENS